MKKALCALVCIGVAYSHAKLAQDVIDDLIHTYAPLVKYCAHDESSPTSVPWYLEKCVLKKRSANGKSTTVLAQGEVNPYVLGNYAQQPRDGEYYLDPLGNKKTLRGESYKEKISDVECYVHVVEWLGSPDNRDVTLQFMFFWAYQGPLIGKKITDPVTKTLDIGIHEGDWEHINVYLRKESGAYVLKKVFYSRHQQRKGVLVYKNDLELVNDAMEPDPLGTHPVVYAACNSHASYPHHSSIPSKYFDVTSDNGPVWRCWMNPRFIGKPSHPLPGYEWIKFAGRWGSTQEQSKIGIEYHGNSPEGPAFGGSFLREESPQRAIEIVIKNKETTHVPVQTKRIEKRKKSERFSEYFSLVPAARHEHIILSIEHPEKEKILYEIWEKKLFTADKNIYGTLSGKRPTLTTLPERCLGIVDACKNLYVANIRDEFGKPLRSNVPIKLIVQGLEY